MNFSAPFIRRPIGTTLLAIGMMLVGGVAYEFLPVSSLPSVEFPTIRISASRPGADPETMAATVAAPLERRLGEIAGVTEMTSTSALGSTSITVQFDLNRSIDGAARDVQSALNAAATDLPSDLPTLPVFRKVNPSASPILILALTSKTMTANAIYDVADSVIAQRMSQVDGVAEVTVSGADQPAVRMRVDPVRLAQMGISMEDVRTAVAGTNALGPVGNIDGGWIGESLATNSQLRKAEDYHTLVVKTVNGNVIRLKDIATIRDSTRNSRSDARFNREPAVLLIVTKQASANVIETVDGIKKLLPDLRRWIPASVEISVLSDRTQTIRASVQEMQLTLFGTVVLVMLVVFVFLRRVSGTVAAGVTVPLSLAGTCGLMWLAGFSIDNLSLMALAVSVGFVVDDAIVMIENCFRNLERGKSPLRSAMEGAKQIGFTVISISISLLAAFIPLLLMGGIVGRLFREFSVTLAFAILVSTVVSLTVTPMICAYFVREAPSPDATRFDRFVESIFGNLLRLYERTLAVIIRFHTLALLVVAGTIALTALLYVKVPKGFIPPDDTGLIFGGTQASPDISFQAMQVLQQKALDIVLADPAIAGVGSSIGTSSFNPSANRGRMFISLKPQEERGGLTTAQVINRLRGRISNIPGLQVFLFAASDVRVGGRQSQSQYQFTLWDPDFSELKEWFPRIMDRVKQVPGLVDVTTDRQQGGLQADVMIDRLAAARLNVPIANIDNALNNAYSQRQISRIYGARNQYQVVLEVGPQFQRDPSDFDQIYVPSTTGAQVPLSALAKFERTLSPLTVNHQKQFPAITITFNLAPGYSLDQVSDEINRAVREVHPPDSLRAEFAGDAAAAASSSSAQPLLILAALIAVYIVLGVLYESLAHPLTIISTLPSAGLGALLALMVTGTELSLIAFIGIILLIGIVKKNGIMLVDFALEAERKRGLAPEQAIFEACIERFRPIMMTTLAAILGAVPLIIASGPGSELRRPLGITIVGGLIVSQVLTLYTTPVIYLLLDKLHRRLGGAGQIVRPPRRNPPAPQPAR
ncbi:MAG TPA: efflux RND transporter permease subunit [Xanthobacteraceae bacterium]|nr:efflux RND transporter permease subunit [Xanthobacteraceae bacterium]